MDFTHSVEGFGRPQNVTQAPARNGISLRERIADNRTLAHARQCREIGVHIGFIDNVLIDFVRNDEGIEFLHDFCNLEEFLTGEYLARGIRRITENERLGPLTESCAQLFGVKIKGRRLERHKNRLSPRKDGIRPVVFVKRRKNGHLVAGIDRCEHRSHHCFRTAACHADFGIRIIFQSAEVLDLFTERFAKVLRTPGRRILVRPFKSHFGETFKDGFGRVVIRKALSQIESTVFCADAAHASNDGIGKCAAAVAQRDHRRSPEILLRSFYCGGASSN